MMAKEKINDGITIKVLVTRKREPPSYFSLILQAQKWLKFIVSDFTNMSVAKEKSVLVSNF